MLKKNVVQEPKPMAVAPDMVEEVTPPMPEAPTADDLGRLRDILFGSQSRSMEKRLGELEADLTTNRHELTNLLNDKVNALAETASSQLADTRRDFNEKLDRQGMDQTSQLRSTQKELSERLERQTADNASQLSAVQKQLSDAIEKLGSDLIRQLRESHKELGDRIDKLGAEQAERTRNLQTETRQRDDALRQELLAMADSLDGKKASRHDLGQMLMELGLRLRQDSDSSN